MKIISQANDKYWKLVGAALLFLLPSFFYTWKHFSDERQPDISGRSVTKEHNSSKQTDFYANPDEHAKLDTTSERLPGRILELYQKLSGDTAESSHVLAEILLLAWKDFPAACQKIQNRLPTDQQNGKIAYLAGLIGAEQLARLDECLLFVKPSGDANMAIAMAVKSWASRDPLRLYNYGISTADERIRTPALAAASQALTKNGHYNDALQAAEHLDNAELRRHTMSYVAARWFTKDSASCLEWIPTIPDSATMLHVASVVSTQAKASLKTDDYVAVVNSTINQDLKSVFLSGLIDKMAESDLKQAMSYATQLTPDVRDQAKVILSRHLLKQSSDEATAYALKIEGQNECDYALDEILRWQTRSGYKNAVAWALSLPTNRRDRQLIGSITLWYRIDPIACNAYVKEMDDGEIKTLALSQFEQ